ncbi:PIN domain nuclease [Methylocapsa sp. S129]|uniref:type II toxin-antitoxin system VapC family toxin n=1 Tax=Methylocapsa sp. S129 TaxID=1641869 RepID=UPI00131B0F00|nr:PIN domain nuclease [Methylocapsa sp. S129]
MIVVDSSVWIANLRNLDIRQVRALRALDDPDEVLVGDVVLLEVLQGARDDARADQLEKWLRRFPIVRMLDEELAARAARNYRLLRKRGVTIRKTIDVIVGTFCLEHDHILLHADRDFDGMAMHLGLRVA